MSPPTAYALQGSKPCNFWDCNMEWTLLCILLPRLSNARLVFPHPLVGPPKRGSIRSTSVGSKVQLKRQFMETISLIETTIQRFALLGDNAVSASDRQVVPRFTDVSWRQLGRMSDASRHKLLATCCDAVWNLYFLVWKVRVNNLLKRKGIIPIKSFPVNSSELKDCIDDHNQGAQISPFVRLLRPNDRNVPDSEKKPSTNPGEFFPCFSSVVAMMVYLRFQAKCSVDS